MGLLKTAVRATKKLADEWDEAAWLKENPKPEGSARSREGANWRGKKNRDKKRAEKEGYDSIGRKIEVENPELGKWDAENPSPVEGIRYSEHTPEQRKLYQAHKKKRERVANPEKFKAREREQYEKHRERKIARQRDYNESNRGAINERQREYYSNNKEQAIANNAKRRAAQLERTPGYSNDEAIKRVYERAGLLSEATGQAHHVDHVIPLQGENVSGLHVPGNLMIMPGNLNISKHNKFTPGDDPMRFNDVAQQNIIEQNAKGLLPGLLAGGVGLGALGQSEDADAGFVTRGGKTLLEAFHGSPHKFDRFSMDQIGTGEGAQAYGHGLYFADSEDVAKGYRDMLSAPTEEAETAAWALGRMGNDREAAIKALETGEGLSMNGPQSLFNDAAKILREEADLTGPGALYRTEIDVTPESLLDWDKPLSEQPRSIQKIATEGVPEFQGFIDELASINPEAAELAEKMMYGPDSVRAGTAEASANWKKLQGLVGDSDIDLNRLHDATDAAYGRRDKWGATFYEELADSPEKASGLLSDRGIKGIKYLDGDSRAVGDGTSNYVIFDDSLINIAERGNADPRLLAGTAAGTAGLLAAPMVKDSGMISSPRSETLFDLTMGARDVERRLEGSPASLLFPSGLVEYLETVNRREEKPNAMTRGMALLDVLPF